MEEYNDELLVIYKKGSDMVYPIKKMIEGSKNLVSRMLNRELIIDIIGDYHILYTTSTDIETIIRELRIECMGEEIEGHGSTVSKVKPSTEIQTLFDNMDKENKCEINSVSV